MPRPPSKTLREIQNRFSAALRNPDEKIPQEIAKQNGCVATKRFSVYRNNVYVSLIEALRRQFPVVNRLVGEEFFTSLARVYIDGNLPKSPLMFEYGDTFPDFLKSFDKVQDLPYLADIARIDYGRTQSYHALDAESLSLQNLAAIPQERFPAASFSLHPSARIIRSEFPILSIWRANTENSDVEEIFLDQGGEDLLIIRPSLTVTVHLLTPGAAEFIDALDQGLTIADAVELAADQSSDFDFAALLPQLTNAGLFIEHNLLETEQ